MSVKNVEKGGGESKGVGDIFQGGGAGGTILGGRDVGDNPQNGPVPGVITTQDTLTGHWEADLESVRRQLLISTSGYDDSGNRV